MIDYQLKSVDSHMNIRTNNIHFFLIKCFVKIFKSSSRVSQWRKISHSTFPIPCDTRWGTWLNSLNDVTQNLKKTQRVCAIVTTNFSKQTKTLLDDQDLIVEVGHIYTLNFIHFFRGHGFHRYKSW